MSDASLVQYLQESTAGAESTGMGAGPDWAHLERTLEVDVSTFRQIQTIASRLRDQNSGKVFKVFHPGRDFPAISVTGTACDLDCLHCDRKYLRGMIPADSPAQLYQRCLKLQDRGAAGCLISGGCDETGAVPLEPFLETLARIKAETRLVLNLHTGLLREVVAEGLAKAGVDIVSFDINLDPAVIDEVYHLDATPETYQQAVRSLTSRGVRVVPHICIGLNRGKIKEELAALQFIETVPADQIVFIVLIPPKDPPGRDYFNRPDPLDVARIITIARLKFPSKNISLGCMRPKDGTDRGVFELESLRSGINGIVLPSKATREWITTQGYEIEEFPTCCALPPAFEKRFK